MDAENALIRSLATTDWLTVLATNTFWPTSGLSWMDRFAEACDTLMECSGLEAYEHPDLPRTIIAFPHRTRRKQPAFIAISPGHGRYFPKAYKYLYASGCTIEFVEAGNYGVAGASAKADTGAEAEDTALQH